MKTTSNTPTHTVWYTETNTVPETPEFSLYKGEESEKSETPTLISLTSPLSQEIPEPKLSEAALYGAVGSIVKKIEPLTEAHPAPILLQTLIGLGNIIGRDPYFVTSNDKQHPNLFGVVVGSSSSGKKGTSMGTVERILGQIDPYWCNDRVMGGIGSGEGVIALLNDKQDEAEDAIADKRLLLVEEEFAQILQAMKRGGNTVSMVIRKAWDSGTLRTITKKTPLKASNCHISLLTHVTREELAYLGKREQTNGFANRCLWCFSSMTKLLPHAKAIDLQLIKGELEAIRNAVKKVRLRRSNEMTRTQEADKYWEQIYNDLIFRPCGIWGHVTQRAAAQVVRLSMIYALLDGEVVIDLKHMKAAKAMWDYCDQSARWAFEGRAYGDHAQRILDALQYGEVTQSQLHDLFHRHPNRRVITQALKEIEHLIDVVTEKTTGRSRTIYRLKE
jgi:Protein of unknown function (DUF3987)